MRRNDLWLVAIITALFFSSLTGCAGRSVVKDANALIAAAIDNPPWAGTERAVDRGVVIGRPTIEPGKRDRLDLASPALRSETVAMITRLDKALSQQIENLSMHQSVLYILIAILAASLIALAWYLWPWNAGRLKTVVTAPSSSPSPSPAGPHATATPSGKATPAIEPVTSAMPADESSKADEQRIAQLISANTVAMLAVVDAMRTHAMAPIPPVDEMVKKGKKDGKKGKKDKKRPATNVNIVINNGGGGGGGACIASPPVATPASPVVAEASAEEATPKTPETTVEAAPELTTETPETPAQEEEPLQMAS